MNELKEIVNLYGKDIAAAFLFFLSYFLTFLYKSAVSKTRRNIGVLLGEQQKYISDADESLRAAFAQNLAEADNALKESKVAYDKAIESIASLQERLSQAENALRIFMEIEEEEVEDGKLPVAQED